MRKWTTKNGYEIFQVLAGRSNSYLVKFGDVIVLVDAGKTSAYKRLIRNIDSLNISPNTQRILVLTHTHFDHCQNAWVLFNSHQFKIVFSQLEFEFAKQGNAPLPKGTNPITGLISKIGRNYFSSRFSYSPFTSDILVDTEMEFSTFGLNIKAVKTPGHSIGSISVIVDDEIALVGDALFGVFPNSVYPPFADDARLMVDSWGQLLQTNCRLFLPGHGNVVSRDLLLKEYTKHSH
ncbi:MAG: MBL fold metallo-hydrolase [Bacteroidales bacterium]